MPKDFKPPIVPVGELDETISWAIYGRSGTGKTTFAATFPTPILLLDIKDQGTMSISDAKNVGVWRVKDWEDFEDAYWYLAKSDHSYQTVVIDTITQLQQLCLQHILTKKRKSIERAGDWGSMTQREWGDASASMKEKITSFRDLPLDVVFIAQEKTSNEEGDGHTENLLVPEVGPAAMKSVAAHLNASVSVIGHTYIRAKKLKRNTANGKIIEHTAFSFCLDIAPNPVYVTKIRKPKSIEVPGYLENPTYDDVIDIIKGKEV